MSSKVLVVDVANQEEKKLKVELYEIPPRYDRDNFKLKFIKELETDKYIDELDIYDVELNYIDLNDDEECDEEYDEDDRYIEDECNIEFPNETNKIRISKYLYKFYLRHQDYYLDISQNQSCIKAIAGNIDILFKVKDKYRDWFQDHCLSKNLSPIALKDKTKKQITLEMGESCGRIFSHLHYSDEMAKMETRYEVGNYIWYQIGSYRIKGRLKVKSPPFKVKFSYYPDHPGIIEIKVNEFFTFYAENHLDFSVWKDGIISEIAEFEIEQLKRNKQANSMGCY